MLLDTLFEQPDSKIPLHENNTCEKNSKLAHKNLNKIVGLTALDVVDKQLGVSSIALTTDLASLMNRLPSLGYTTTKNYNQVIVQTCKGCYRTAVGENSINIIIPNATEAGLNVALDSWQCIYAVRELTESGYCYSLQFFGENGTAIQKIFMHTQSNFDAYQHIVNDYKSKKSKKSTEKVQQNIGKTTPNIHKNIDLRALIIDWRTRGAINHITELSKKYGIDYQEIYHYLGDVYAEELSIKKLEIILEQVSERNMPISLYTFSNGISQYYSGVLDNVSASGDYLYCSAADFSLQILETSIANAWLVRKATPSGIVTFLEFYDAYGKQLFKLHGYYNDKYSESIHWKRLAESALQYCSSGYLIRANKSNAAYIKNSVAY